MNLPLAGLVVAAYLLGSVPFGLLLGRAFGHVDVRGAGSGNIGATNVARVAGRGLGVLTLVLDALKGFAPTWGMIVLAEALAPEAQQPIWVAATGFAAFLGHCYPPWLRFKGGKGVATAFGVLLAAAPFAAVVGFVLYALVYATLRISSVGSLLAAAVVPVLVFVTEPAVQGWFVLAMVAVILWKHRGNIQRLLSRSEGRV